MRFFWLFTLLIVIDIASAHLPHAIQIVNVVNNTFKFDLTELKNILEADDVKDRKVVIVATTGVFRKGKNFLLNFYLRYLYAQNRKHNIYRIGYPLLVLSTYLPNLFYLQT